jgi:hypothetical protein
VPGADVDGPLTANTPVTILSPNGGGDATQPGGDTPTAPSGDTPTGPDGDTPTGPGGTAPGGPGDDGSGAGNGGPDSRTGAFGGPGDRGTQDEFSHSPSSGDSVTTAVRRELGALAGNLPFTGLLLWALALAGLVALAGGLTGRRAAATS